MKKTLMIALSAGVIFFGSVFAWQKVVATNGTAAKVDYGEYVTKEIEGIGDFSSIFVMGSPDVEYVQSPEVSVRVYAPETIIRDHLEVKTNNGELKVSLVGTVNPLRPLKVKVYVTGPKLTHAKVQGSGDISIKSDLRTDSFTAEVQGSGEIDCGKIETGSVSLYVQGSGDISARGDLQTGSFTAEVQGSGEINCVKIGAGSAILYVQGSGDIEIDNMACATAKATVQGSGGIDIKGNAESAGYTLTGSGDIDAGYMVANTVTATLTGTGDIECYASKRLDASVNGTGSIEYRGNPSVVNKSGKERAIRPSR